MNLPIGMDIRSITVAGIDLGVGQEQNEHYQRAVRRFKQTMRRHILRARRMGLTNIAGTLEIVREVARGSSAADDEGWMSRSAAEVVNYAKTDRARRCRWFYDRAADACAKLAEAQRQFKAHIVAASEMMASGWALESFSFGSVGTAEQR